jgi:hypothetical protein
MTSCDDVERALVAGDAGDAVQAHLTGCAGCRAFEAAQRAAHHARHLELRLRTRPRRSAVVRRAAVVALALVAVTSAGVWSSRAPTSTATAPEPLAPTRLETSLTAAAPEPDHAREWAALVTFTQTLDDTLYRDVTTSDATYTAFGALPRWVAPQSTLTALEN